MEKRINSGTNDLGRILLLEDDPTYRLFLHDFLVREGYAVLEAARAEEALKHIRHSLPSAALVDWTLPGMSGLGFCQRVRASGFLLPIVFLSARSDMGSQLEALQNGADDYLVKPVSLVLLRSRLLSVSKPLARPGGGQSRLPLLDAEFDPAAGTLTRAGTQYALQGKESGILDMLVRAGGQTVSRQEILAGVWRFQYLPVTRSVDIYLMKLRRTLLQVFGEEVRIQTVRGRGFALVTDFRPAGRV